MIWTQARYRDYPQQRLGY